MAGLSTLSGRQGYVTALAGAKRAATAVLEGQQGTHADARLDEAHVVLDGLALLERSIRTGAMPWREYT
jgi:hypothetical protein